MNVLKKSPDLSGKKLRNGNIQNCTVKFKEFFKPIPEDLSHLVPEKIILVYKTLYKNIYSVQI